MRPARRLLLIFLVAILGPGLLLGFLDCERCCRQAFNEGSLGTLSEVWALDNIAALLRPRK